MNTKTKRILLALILFFLFVNLVPALAAEDSLLPLVRCGNEGQAACTFNDIFVTLGRVVSFVLADIVPPLAILGVVLAAIIMMTSGGDPGKFKQGRDAMMAIAIGLIIIYLSWWIVKSFVQFLGGQEWTLKFFNLTGN